jgi:DNA-directed RNA polymerase specialized sigma24 family protein
MRIAAVRAATVTSRYRLPTDYRRDFEQEALLELWRKRSSYDPRRGCWRTFSERVVANKITSLVRHMYSERSPEFRKMPLEDARSLAAPYDDHDLRVDVLQVLASMSSFDKAVARSLMVRSTIATGKELGVCRATVYRAIGRLRMAFTKAGLTPRCFRRGSITAQGVVGA